MSTTRERWQREPSPIQKKSSPSVSIFSLNQSQVRTCLKQAVTTLAVEHPEIDEVWLFGSLARGDAVPGSDADLLIVLRDSKQAFLERLPSYQPDYCGIGVDVLAYTRDELAQMKAAGNPLWQQVRSEGQCLYRRDGTVG